MVLNLHSQIITKTVAKIRVMRVFVDLAMASAMASAQVLSIVKTRNRVTVKSTTMLL